MAGVAGVALVLGACSSSSAVGHHPSRATRSTTTTSTSVLPSTTTTVPPTTTATFAAPPLPTSPPTTTTGPVPEQPQTVVVPNVVGMLADEAAGELFPLGLASRDVQDPDDPPTGQIGALPEVVGQQPAPGTIVVVGSVVTLVVGGG